MTKEDKIQIALGLKFLCAPCGKVLELKVKVHDITISICYSCMVTRVVFGTADQEAREVKSIKRS